MKLYINLNNTEYLFSIADDEELDIKELITKNLLNVGYEFESVDLQKPSIGGPNYAAISSIMGEEWETTADAVNSTAVWESADFFLNY